MSARIEPASDPLTLDGNAVAGLLLDVFDVEVTAEPRACQSCGEVNPVGAHRAYRAAGTVLRCPACGDIALTIVETADAIVVRLRGSWAFSVPRAPEPPPG